MLDQRSKIRLFKGLPFPPSTLPSLNSLPGNQSIELTDILLVLHLPPICPPPTPSPEERHTPTPNSLRARGDEGATINVAWPEKPRAGQTESPDLPTARPGCGCQTKSPSEQPRPVKKQVFRQSPILYFSKFTKILTGLSFSR